MDFVLYRAMTAAEFEKNPHFSMPMAWMACHFSPYATGLSNLPRALPVGSLLIVNDRTPIAGHDPAQIARVLDETVRRLDCSGILLDFQHDGAQTVAAAVAALPCPVAVTPPYAAPLSCGVFLPPPALCTPLREHLAPWTGREIWLEAALQGATVRVTRDGSRTLAAPPGACPHTDEVLHCRYGMDVRADHVDFSLQRDASQLDALLDEAVSLGVTHFVGLYQQLGDFSSHAEAQATARRQL